MRRGDPRRRASVASLCSRSSPRGARRRRRRPPLRVGGKIRAVRAIDVDADRRGVDLVAIVERRLEDGAAPRRRRPADAAERTGRVLRRQRRRAHPLRRPDAGARREPARRRDRALRPEGRGAPQVPAADGRRHRRPRRQVPPAVARGRPGGPHGSRAARGRRSSSGTPSRTPATGWTSVLVSRRAGARLGPLGLRRSEEAQRNDADLFVRDVEGADDARPPTSTATGRRSSSRLDGHDLVVERAVTGRFDGPRTCDPVPRARPDATAGGDPHAADLARRRRRRREGRPPRHARPGPRRQGRRPAHLALPLPGPVLRREDRRARRAPARASTRSRSRSTRGSSTSTATGSSTTSPTRSAGRCST